MMEPRKRDPKPVHARRAGGATDAAPPQAAGSKSRMLILAFGGGGIAILLGVAVFLLLKDGPERFPETPPAAPPPAAVRHAPASEPAPADRRKDAEADDKAAEAPYAAAAQFEKDHPGEAEKALAQYREVFVRHPATSWARKAETRYHALSESIRAALDREFETVRRAAQELVKGGRTPDALEALRKYAASQPRELLRRRAEIEIAEVENASRLGYNALLPRAEEHARAGRQDEAIALFEEYAKGAIPEVAARCATSVEELKTARRDYQAYLETAKVEEAHRAVRERVAPKVLELVRGRRYDEAIRELEAALRAAEYAPVRASIEAERAAVSLAALFWEGFMKMIRPMLNQEAWFLLQDGNWAGGKLTKLLPDRMVFKTAEKEVEVPYAQISIDQVVGLSLGRALPADAADSYVKAALYFFCEGRDDLAKHYFATAQERGANLGAHERVFREGYLRAAAHAAK